MGKRWFWVAAGLLGLAACGGDSSGPLATGTSLARYCQVTAKLDKASDQLITSEADTPEEIKKGFTQLFEDYGPDLEDLVEAAPAAIKADVAKGVDAFRKAADGDFSAMETFDDSKIADFDAKNCK
ncbi:MAG TPA: hypothetical protein VGL92_14035 [Acidimicrobiia bacterium]